MLLPTHASKLVFTLLVLLAYSITSTTSLPLPRSSKKINPYHRPWLNEQGSTRPPVRNSGPPASFIPWNNAIAIERRRGSGERNETGSK
ncbi:hypothetical protein BKA70DRAFT_675865 [Coprinopsis sp. MPI-PUGE-AT-0042]|nr:hypothetical protein BKA70DRAFT_675865 [Coprinopsis sp. MPI-PUGE-AT-0042]